MSEKIIYAGIVLYKPDMKRLNKNIRSILPQVDQVLIYDNGINIEYKKQIEQICPSKLTLLGCGENNGLARALNEIMKYAEREGAQWVITLDQDSVSPDNMVSEYKKRMQDDKTGIICPRIVDKRRFYMTEEQVDKTDCFVEKCITSASCTLVKAWHDVGAFDDFLFIDLIDNDFCKRLRIKGWNILKINSLVLDQEFGNIRPKKPRVVNFYRKLSKSIKNPNLSENIAKLSYKKQVSPMRVYYINRNVLYLNKKLINYGGIGYESYNSKSYFGFMIAFNFASFARGKEKIKILNAILKGIKDGRKAVAIPFKE